MKVGQMFNQMDKSIPLEMRIKEKLKWQKIITGNAAHVGTVS